MTVQGSYVVLNVMDLDGVLAGGLFEGPLREPGSDALWAIARMPLQLPYWRG